MLWRAIERHVPDVRQGKVSLRDALTPPIAGRRGDLRTVPARHVQTLMGHSTPLDGFCCGDSTPPHRPCWVSVGITRLVS